MCVLIIRKQLFLSVTKVQELTARRYSRRGHSGFCIGGTDCVLQSIQRLALY